MKGNKMKKAITSFVLLLLLGVGISAYYVLKENPALIIKTSDNTSVTQTIIDHKLPKLLTSYKHLGKPEIIVTKVWRERENSPNEISLNDQWLPQIYWCKVIDKKQEQEKPLWKKVADKIISLLRFMAFDERGAFLLTERNYVVDNEVLPGEYIYLGSLRLTIHIEGQGTLTWEFPGYVDRAMPYDKLNSIMKLNEKDMVNLVQQAMYSTAVPEQSYKVKLTERGAMRQETLWAGIAYDITLEYIGNGINAQ